MFAASLNLNAQDSSFWDETDLEPFQASGSISLSASGYTVDGIDNRRAPTLLQTDASVNVNTFGFRSGFNINYSTDDSGLRQNMNNIYYNATWRWLNVQAGDVNTSFSEYGLSGTSVRGGYIRIEPGDFLLELLYGRTRRAVRPTDEVGFREPSFERWSGGGKIGYGGTSGSYFHISTFYSIDERASLDGEEIEITPKENLTITPDFRLDLLDGSISLESEVTVSVYTRDLESENMSFDDIRVPSFFTNIYQPKNTSRVNYAGHSSLFFVSNPFDLTLGYERVQPGFISLGRGQTRDDQETISVTPALRFFDNRLNIQSNIVLGRDNLLGSRLQTQTNTNVNTNVQMMFTDQFSLNTNYDLFLNDVKPEDEEGFEQSQVSHNIMVQPNVNFRRGDYSHSISVSGGFMIIENSFTDDLNGNDSTTSESITTNANYSITLPGGLSINTSGNYMINTSEGADINSFGGNIGTSYSFFDRSLTVSFNGGYNRSTTERTMFEDEIDINTVQQISGSLNTNYRITNNDSFSLSVRARSNSVVEGIGSEYNELEGTFQYQRTF